MCQTLSLARGTSEADRWRCESARATGGVTKPGAHYYRLYTASERPSHKERRIDRAHTVALNTAESRSEERMNETGRSGWELAQ